MPEFIVTLRTWYVYEEERRVTAETEEDASYQATHWTPLDFEIDTNELVFDEQETSDVQRVGRFGVHFWVGNEDSAMSKAGFETLAEAAEVAIDVLIHGRYNAQLAHVGYNGVRHLPFRLTHAVVFEQLSDDPYDVEDRQWLTKEGQLFIDPERSIWERVQEVLGLEEAA